MGSGGCRGCAPGVFEEGGGVTGVQVRAGVSDLLFICFARVPPLICVYLYSRVWHDREEVDEYFRANAKVRTE